MMLRNYKLCKTYFPLPRIVYQLKTLAHACFPSGTPCLFVHLFWQIWYWASGQLIVNS